MTMNVTNSRAVQDVAELRAAATRRGRWLQYVTIAWNSLECVAALIAGFLAGSIALVGFGFDSAIEVASSLAALWRLRWDADEARREAAERHTLRTLPDRRLEEVPARAEHLRVREIVEQCELDTARVEQRVEQCLGRGERFERDHREPTFGACSLSSGRRVLASQLPIARGELRL